MKPILLTVWPQHLDYPLFRYNLKRFGKYFASVWIGITNHHIGVNYTNFIRAEVPEAHFVEVKHEGADWRNDAINEVLERITTPEPICFIEQDFLIADDKFFEKLFSEHHDFLFFKEDRRVHPAFAVVGRELIEQTSKDFSAYPDTYGDHFAKFFSELPQGKSLGTFSLRSTYDFYHLNGLSQNYMNVKNDQPLYNPTDFLYYNFMCLRNARLYDHPQFYQIEVGIDRKYGHPKTHEFLDKFFPQ